MRRIIPLIVISICFSVSTFSQTIQSSKFVVNEKSEFNFDWKGEQMKLGSNSNSTFIAILNSTKTEYEIFNVNAAGNILSHKTVVLAEVNKLKNCELLFLKMIGKEFYIFYHAFSSEKKMDLVYATKISSDGTPLVNQSKEIAAWVEELGYYKPENFAFVANEDSSQFAFLNFKTIKSKDKSVSFKITAHVFDEDLKLISSNEFNVAIEGKIHYQQFGAIPYYMGMIVKYDAFSFYKGKIYVPVRVNATISSTLATTQWRAADVVDYILECDVTTGEYSQTELPIDIYRWTQYMTTNGSKMFMTGPVIDIKLSYTDIFYLSFDFLTHEVIYKKQLMPKEALLLLDKQFATKPAIWEYGSFFFRVEAMSVQDDGTLLCEYYMEYSETEVNRIVFRDVLHIIKFSQDGEKMWGSNYQLQGGGKLISFENGKTYIYDRNFKPPGSIDNLTEGIIDENGKVASRKAIYTWNTNSEKNVWTDLLSVIKNESFLFIVSNNNKGYFAYVKP